MKSPKVLIVDDEQEFVMTLVERLSLRGIAAEGVTRGEQAVNRVTEDPFDVVLLDVKMPGLGCPEVIKHILNVRPHTAIILMTGYGSITESEASLGKGAHDCMVKPININDLIARIKTAVPE